MKVSFAVSIDPADPLISRDDADRYAQLVKMAESYGARAIGTYDSAFIGGDALFFVLFRYSPCTATL